MRILFCSDPLTPRAPDTMYEAEVAAAEQAGFTTNLINFERLVYEKRPAAAVSAVPQSDTGELCLFRGWMMTPPDYTLLYEALQGKGLTLINDPAAYRHCHYFPENYSIIEPYTPKSVWIPHAGIFEIERVMGMLALFGDVPLILKDYVKSRKHEWAKACYIPAANSRADVKRVMERFLELQGDDLNEGLVFREFIPFRALTSHSKSGMPLTVEYRCFVINGAIELVIPYWEEGVYELEPPPIQQFAAVAQQVQSRFYTMDIAQQENGEWMIVELGDGQVAGLPDTTTPDRLYQRMAEAFPSD